MNDLFHCLACHSASLQPIEGFAELPRVTSDSKPFRSGGKLFVCAECGMVQKIPDEQWLSEISEIYRDYEMYHQAAAIDQVVFDPVSGIPRGRCEVLAGRLVACGRLPQGGTLLDVGAGSGAMLGAFSGASDAWRLYGLDLDNRKEETLQRIPRFEQLITIPPEQVAQRFELLTLIHSLEHFPDPCVMLKTLRNLIAPGGKLFIEVNNVDKMLFDLVVADHLSHFTPASLGDLVGKAGYEIDLLATDWVNKEISLLVSPGGPVPGARANAAIAYEQTRQAVNWLRDMLARARQEAQQENFGIFGTSVAATWLAAGIGEKVAFFVDEDPARQGISHLGRPILLPEQVPPGATVFLAFIPLVATAIAARLAKLPICFSRPQA